MLRSTTDPRWVEVALGDLDATLSDHLHCERKAAASALSLVRFYPERSELTRRLSRLAHEETRHLVEVAGIIERRGQAPRLDRGDPYARALLGHVRQGEPARQLDLLLVAALIEARSAERLGLLAQALEERDPPLAAFYARLAQAEQGHRELFVELARPLVPAATFSARLDALAAAEAEILAGRPLEPRIH